MKRIMIAMIVAVLPGCREAPPAPQGGLPQAKTEPATLEPGREAIIYAPDVTQTSVIMWAGEDLREMVTPDVGARVLFLGRIPERRKGKGDEARIRVIEGEGSGKVGFIAVSNLRPLDH